MARRPKGPLRRGWTTGACATAAASAAFQACHTGRFPDPVAISLPRGLEPAFALAVEGLQDGAAYAGVIKDAGDDPDVTHGALVRARVRPLAAGRGLVFRAGEGVGTVTLPGLPLPPGEPAINPAPRRMIADNLEAAAGALGVPPDAEIEIAIPGGEALARQTSNARLGILGGLSILGTTGVVIPYSCSSWIHSIHRGIDVARAAGLDHIAASTGRTSEAAVQARYGLPEQALIDMGDFAGGLLKYLRDHPVERLSIAGGFAKLSKLAAGHLDLHSGRSRVDVDFLAGLLRESGGAELAGQIASAASAGQVLQLAGEAGLPLGGLVAARARETALATLSGGIAVEVLAYDREGGLVGHAA